MDDTEFNKLLKKSQTTEFSPFAKFCMDSKGYRYEKNGIILYKYQVFDMGYTNAEDIINGNTPIMAIKVQT